MYRAEKLLTAASSVKVQLQGGKPALISVGSSRHTHSLSHTRARAHTHKVTLLFPPSAFDLLITTASHQCLWPSSTPTGAAAACLGSRCRTLKDAASGASSGTFSPHTPLLHCYPIDVCGSGLNPGHGREVWRHERHEGSRSKMREVYRWVRFLGEEKQKDDGQTKHSNNRLRSLIWQCLRAHERALAPRADENKSILFDFFSSVIQPMRVTQILLRYV